MSWPEIATCSLAAGALWFIDLEHEMSQIEITIAAELAIGALIFFVIGLIK